MPVAVSYPGVYIEEIPSGVRTIAGVPTSIAAFIGRAKRGPSDLPVLINSFSDFERVFGGLWVDGSLGYAVRDFYLNGGGQGAKAETIPEFERRYLERLMAACQGNETSAAKRAGRSGAHSGSC